MLHILRSCYICSAPQGISFNGTFCRSCEQKILKTKIREEKMDDIRAYYIFDWRPERAFVETLIHNYKTGQANLEVFAKIFSRHMMEQKKFAWPVCVVPSPPRITNKTDHATQLAQVISNKINADYVHCLLRTSDEEQKGRAIKERRKIVLSLNHGAEAQLARHTFKTILFVDDVISSGSTVRAAHRALGQPKNFIVFAIARRPLLQNA